jgi:hypothetical protein
MKRIATSPSLHLFAALLLCLGVLSYAVEAASQLGIVERPQMSRGGPMRPGEAEGEAKYINVPKGYKVVMIAPEDSVVHLMGTPEIPPPLAVNVWIEAIFVELDSGLTRPFEKAIGFKLSPPDGKAILNGEEKERVIAAIEKTEGAAVIASLAVLTVSGQQVQSEHIDELTYATEYEFKEDRVIPGNWEKRDVGAMLNVTPLATEDGRISLVLMPEVTSLTEWQKIDGTDVTQPLFTTWNQTTSVIIPDGSTFVLKESKPLHASQTVVREAANPREDQKTRLLIISAKIVEVPREEEAVE